jgi:hypothetical protein
LKELSKQLYGALCRALKLEGVWNTVTVNCERHSTSSSYTAVSAYNSEAIHIKAFTEDCLR